MLRESPPTALARRSVPAIGLLGFAAACLLSALGAKAPAGEPAGEPDPALAGDPLYQEFLRVNYVFNRELYELCIPRYEKILAAKPGPALAPHVRHALALCHYHLASKAREASASALASVAPEAATRSGTGGAIEGKAAQHARKAIEHLRVAILDRKFGARAAATVTLGQTFLLLGDSASAAQAFAWVLERGSAPEDIEAALAGLADAKYRSGDFEGAARAYRQILERAPAGDARERAEFALGLSIYRKLERSAAADLRDDAEAAECERIFAGIAARAESPLAGDAAYMLALLLERRGDDEAAVARFAELARSGRGEHAELARFGLASALARSGKHREACVEWERFLEAHPASERRDLAAVQLARSLLEVGRRDEGAAILRKLLRSPSAATEAAILLARAEAAEGGDPAKAAAAFEEVLAARPSDPRRAEVELELAAARIEAGEAARAVESLKRLAEKPESGERAAYLLAYALSRSGDAKASLEACARFRASYPKSAFLDSILAIEAEDHFLSGDYLRAHEAYEASAARLAGRGDPSRAAKAKFRAAEALYFAGEYAKAAEALRALASSDHAGARDPALSNLRLLLADCAYQSKDYENAAVEFRRFLEEASAPGGNVRPEDLAEARFKLAHALQLAGKADAAEEAYRAALAKDPSGPRALEVRFELGQLAFARKDYAAASVEFEEVARAGGPEKLVPNALRFLGWIAREGGDPKLAAEKYGELVRRFPEHPLAADAEIELAACLQACGRGEEAAELLRAFAKKRPGDPRVGLASLREAQALAKAGKHAEALSILEKLRDSGGGGNALPAVLYEIAWCHRALGDLGRARESYRRILESPSPGELGSATRLELAELEFDRGAYAEAKALLSPLAGASPNEKALYRLAWCSYQLGEHADAIACEKAFSEAFPESEFRDELALVAARSHLALGRAGEAEAIFRRVASGPADREESKLAAVSLGECLLESRKFREAAEAFREFLARNPEGGLAYRARFGLAFARENLGDGEDAIRLYRRVVEETDTAFAARAQFQIGQCLAARERYEDAIVEFLQVPARFGYREWTSRALLQVAGCFEALGDREKARKYYREVIESHPDRDEAALARERLARLERT